jgi:2-deoxystreptamine N-acetyl-D-glucosaminyltransferase/2-deoxystreptamine glucosyltransferase
LDLRDLGVEVTWVVAGDGPDLPRLRAAVAEGGVSGAFRFVGWQQPLMPLLTAFDVIAMPSNFEGLPLTAIEAAIARTPVVAFGVDGIPELLPAPFAVPPGDERTFARVLGAVLGGRTAWPADAMAARATALCNPEAVADRFLAVLANSERAR